ncbi:MAG: RpoL/Rpb11 RNA polymerase subunit family protein [Candidatus Aenigmatarchaeota archaeon]
MEIKKLRDDDAFMIEIAGESKTFANLIVEELWNDEDVSEAAAIKEHPYMDQPKIFLKMKGKQDPNRTLRDAAKRIEVKIKELEREFSRNIK